MDNASYYIGEVKLNIFNEIKSTCGKHLKGDKDIKRISSMFTQGWCHPPVRIEVSSKKVPEYIEHINLKVLDKKKLDTQFDQWKCVCCYGVIIRNNLFNATSNLRFQWSFVQLHEEKMK